MFDLESGCKEWGGRAVHRESWSEKKAYRGRVELGYGIGDESQDVIARWTEGASENLGENRDEASGEGEGTHGASDWLHHSCCTGIEHLGSNGSWGNVG